jgi:hypothetical protein
MCWLAVRAFCPLGYKLGDHALLHRKLLKIGGA